MSRHGRKNRKLSGNLLPIIPWGKYLVTLLIQGGEYEFAPFIRGKERGEENFDEVARLFDGSYENKIVKDAEAGTLNLFNGMRSLHRVRTVSAS